MKKSYQCQNINRQGGKAILKVFPSTASGAGDQTVVAIDVKRKKVFFKRSIDREEGFLKVKEAAANEQLSSIIKVLRAVAA